MGCFEVGWDVEGEVDLDAEVDELLREMVDDPHHHYKIIKEAKPCPRCRDNNDPLPILKAGYYPRCYRGAACRCRVVEVDGDRERDTRRDGL